MNAEREKNAPGEVNTGGGAYVGGDVNTQGGDFVGRDKIVHSGNVAGATVGEFVALLAEMRRLLPQAGVDRDTAEAIEGDFRVVEEQSQKDKPNKAIIVSKLQGVTALLTAAAGAATAAKSLLPLAQKAVEWAGQLFR